MESIGTPAHATVGDGLLRLVTPLLALVALPNYHGAVPHARRNDAYRWAVNTMRVGSCAMRSSTSAYRYCSALTVKTASRKTRRTATDWAAGESVAAAVVTSLSAAAFIATARL